MVGNADWDRDLTRTERDDAFPNDRARETRTSGDLTATANGTLFKLPAGNAGTTLQLGVASQHLDSSRRSADDFNATSLGRTTGTAAINLDLPIRAGTATSARSAISRSTPMPSSISCRISAP